MNSKFDIYTKMIPAVFIKIDDIEFDIEKLCQSLSDLSDTEEDSKYGEYCLRSYEVNDLNTINKLVKLGYVRKYTGPRMAICYCKNNEKEFEEFKNKVYNLYEIYEKETKQK